MDSIEHLIYPSMKKKHFFLHHLLFNISITIEHGYPKTFNIVFTKVMSTEIPRQLFRLVYVMVW